MQLKSKELKVKFSMNTDFQKHFYTVGGICFGKSVKKKSECACHLFLMKIR